MKYCELCGSQKSAVAKFCPKCGKRVLVVSGDLAKTGKTSMRWLKWFVFALAIVLLVMVYKPDNHSTLPVGQAQKILEWTSLKTAVDSKISRKNYIVLSDIPLSLQQAVIAVEDHGFYQHGGIDFESIVRAILVNIQSGGLRDGGSTITQQLVRNLLLSQESTMGQKMSEVLLSLLAEWKYTKGEILEMYLNTARFGSGVYGIVEASQKYFAKPPKSLSLAESAMLAGMTNDSSTASTLVDFQAAKKRQADVLSALAKYGYIEPHQDQDSRNAPLRFVMGDLSRRGQPVSVKTTAVVSK